MNTLDWKRLKSRYVMQDQWLSVRADTCQMPNGQIVESYYVLEYPTWVTVVALTKVNEVVLVRQYRHGLQQTALELPSGAVEPTDASPLQAIQRELLEETGYTSKNFIATGKLSPNSANHTNLVHCFLATEVERVADVRLDNTEQIEVVLIPIEKLVELVEHNVFLQALHVSALFIALKTLGKISFL